MRKTHKKLFAILIKVIILILSYGFIYKQVFYNKSLDEIINTFQKPLLSGNYKIISLVFMLMFVNRGLEAVKWKILISKIENISFFRSMQAILSGTTISLFTPNGTCEFIGRVFFLHHADRIEGTVITIIGNFSQTLITIVLGCFSIIFFTWKMFSINIYIFGLLAFLLVSISIISIMAYYNINILSIYLSKKKLFAKYSKYIDIFSYYNKLSLTKILFLSFSRYIVFTFQFLLLLWLYNVNISVSYGIVIISLIFLMQTIIPSIALAELGIRGSVAIYFLSSFSNNNLEILSATYGIWLINIVISGILGSFFILKLKFFR